MIKDILFQKRILSDKNITNLKCILGRVFDITGKQIAVSLELPDLKNQKYISCIPTGLYLCTPDSTGKHQYFQINNVKDREDVEIHIANKASDVKGCFGWGDKWAVIGNEGFIRNSRTTLDLIKEAYPKGFWLLISDEVN